MSDYKDIIDKMQWSYSRLTSFEHCKYEFYLQYIVNNEDEYLSEGNYYAEVGSFVHDTLARLFNNEIPEDEVAEYFVNNFDDNVFYKTRQSIMNNTFEKCAEYFSDSGFDWINKYEIIGVEKEVHFTIDTYNFIGFIDLLLRDKTDNRMIVVDHKSGEYPFKKNGEVKAKVKDSFDDYKRQMYLYSHAIYKLYNEFPKELTWNHFKDGGKLATIPFDKKDYALAKRWAIDTIYAIEKEEEWCENQDSFYCYNLCNFRSSCEYNK